MSSETQASITSWAVETFGNAAPESPRHCLRLLEEVAELCIAAGASQADCAIAAQKPFQEAGMRTHDRSPSPAMVGEEMGDCYIVLANIAGRRGIDLHAEVDRKMAINRARKWAVRGDGTGYHIKEGG